MVSLFIVLYLFFAGMGSSAFLIGCSVDFLMRLKPSKRLGRISLVTDAGMFVGPFVVLLGAAFLVVDLGVPERFLLAFLSPKSVLTWGAWGISLFSLFSLLALILSPVASSLVGKVAESACQVTAIACATFVLLYSAAFLSSYPSVPLLHSPMVPILFTCSSVSAGLALLFLIAFARGRFTGLLGEMRPLVHLEAVVTIVELLALMAFVGYAAFATPAAASSLQMLLTGSNSALFWVGAVLTGILIPLAVDFMNARRVNMWLVGACSVCVVAGTFCLRYATLASSVRFAVSPFTLRRIQGSAMS